RNVFDPDFVTTLTILFSSRRRHTRWPRDWSSDVCSSDLMVWKRLTRQPRAMTQAACWIGNFHTVHVHRIDDPSLAFLRRYDAEYYRGWAQRTFEFSRPLHGRFPWLTILCGANEWFAPLLAQPQTVIHGEFYAKTILVRNENVFMVDW